MDSINKLIKIFRDFPTVGGRTAGRFVYYLMKLPRERIDELIEAILEVKNKIKLCSSCFNPFEEDGRRPTSTDLCQICQNPARDKNILCIVEKESDLLSLENTKKFNGLYFILGGTIGTMRKEEIASLRIEKLKKRVSTNTFYEIIIALNPTPEGRTTSVLVEQTIKSISPNIKLTHLARGIPVGGELEYADEETLESALQDRK